MKIENSLNLKEEKQERGKGKEYEDGKEIVEGSGTAIGVKKGWKGRGSWEWKKEGRKENGKRKKKKMTKD